MLTMLLLQRFIGLLLISFANGDSCPVFISPPEVVVEFGASFSVNCSTNTTFGLSWELNEETVEYAGKISKTVDAQMDWESNLTCYMYFNATQTCSQNLPVTIYKTPDSVSISTGTHTGPMTEGNQYELLCDIHSVAPVQNLKVNWYKEKTLVNQTNFNDTIKSPVNAFTKLLIHPNRFDDGAQFWCEAELKLGEEEPQPPLKVTSDPLNISVEFSDCPIFFNPPEVVVEYGASFSVNCSTNTKFGLSWEPNEKTLDNSSEISKSVDAQMDWESNLTCYIYFNATQTCSLNLPVTIYKTPDSVSISAGNHIGPMIEGNQYELQCDIHNMAPVQSLTVNWYKGETLVNQTSFNDTIKSPVNKTATLLIHPHRFDDGATTFRCEAELQLEEEGPQPPKVTSNPIKIAVEYKGCPIQIIPQKAVVKYGGVASANCKALVPHNGMGWESTVGAVPLSKDKMVTWNVSDFRHWDIQPPICHINLKDQCTEVLPITIYKTPNSVLISTGTHIGPMVEGKQYELQCDIHDVAPVQNLTVNWYKGETLVNQTSFNETIKSAVSKSATFVIRPDRHDDGAQFRCEAVLKLGEYGPKPPPNVKSDPLNIVVHYPPEIMFCGPWTLKKGMSLVSNLSSYFVGSPHPSIIWKLKSSPVNAYAPLTKYDSGQYEITASNAHNSSSCTTHITVEYSPELYCNESFEAKEETLFSPCVVDGLPKPKLSLFKEGKMLRLPYSLKWNDSGRYQYTAENKHGAVNTSFAISVLHAPRFYDSQEHFVVADDDNITLECISSGNPEPDMLLIFKNKTISTGRRKITFNIGRATSTRAGSYTCIATNKFARHEKIFTVEKTDNSRSYLLVIILGLLLLVLILIFLLFFWWRRRRAHGYYNVKQLEMCLVSNGSSK